MKDYRVELDAYHGPLDLLLYLIRRDEIDINDIPISPITNQYMQYLKTLKTLDINLAGEFLVMAATLMEVKSAMLIPREGDEESDLTAAEDPTDPRYELIHQLLAYKRFKDAASQLSERKEEFAAKWARSPVVSNANDEKVVELDIEDVQLWDLVEAFGRIIEQTGSHIMHEVVADDTPLELHMADLVDRLQRDGAMTLRMVFEGRNQGEMIGLFLAMLELVRMRRLAVRQDEAGGEIELELLTRADSEDGEGGANDENENDALDRAEIDPKNIDAFEWGDEELKKRYARRQEKRAKGEEVEEDVEMAADIAELEAKEMGDAVIDVPASGEVTASGVADDDTGTNDNDTSD